MPASPSNGANPSVHEKLTSCLATLHRHGLGKLSQGGTLVCSLQRRHEIQRIITGSKCQMNPLTLRWTLGLQDGFLASLYPSKEWL